MFVKNYNGNQLINLQAANRFEISTTAREKGKHRIYADTPNEKRIILVEYAGDTEPERAKERWEDFNQWIISPSKHHQDTKLYDFANPTKLDLERTENETAKVAEENVGVELEPPPPPEEAIEDAESGPESEGEIKKAKPESK